MLLLIDIFSINKGQGHENPSLEIIVTERCLIGGCPLEEAYEHCFLNQSAIYVVVLISFMCYCGDYTGYITIILPFLAFYFCSAYFLYLVSCRISKKIKIRKQVIQERIDEAKGKCSRLIKISASHQEFKNSSRRGQKN
jgi:hypothetical protein